MSFQAGSFVSGEVPTVAQWNVLWSNDSSFNLGTGISALTIGSVTNLTNPYKFSATYAPSGNIGDGTANLVTNASKVLDTSSNFSTSTSLLTSPIPALWQFNFGAGHNNAGSYLAAATLVKNGSTIVAFGSEVTSSYANSTGSRVVALNAGDTIGLYCVTLTAALAYGTSNYLDGFVISNA